MAPNVGAYVQRHVDPGPGSYDVKLSKGRTTVIGRGAAEIADANVKANLEKLKEAKQTPGPADYNLPPHVGKEGRWCTFAGRTHTPKKAAADIPGPGTYEMQNNHGPAATSTKKFGFGGRHPEPTTDAVRFPGPGTYVAPSDFDPAVSMKKGITIKGREAIDGRAPPVLP
jgi:hypothetical protein